MSLSLRLNVSGSGEEVKLSPDLRGLQTASPAERRDVGVHAGPD